MRTTYSSSLARALIATALGVTLTASAASAQAQESGTRFGAELAYADHFNLGVGAFVKFHLTQMSGHTITGRASFDYFFPGGVDYGCGFNVCSYTPHYWQAAFDGLYDIANAKSDLKPYVGAGLGLTHFSQGSDYCGVYDCGSSGGLGLNILGGINFMANSKLQPFVEVRLGFAGSIGAYGSSEFMLKGGVHFK